MIYQRGDCMFPSRKTHEQFILDVKSKYGDEYTVLGSYSNNKTKILVRHNTCGNEYDVRPDKFLQGRRCFKCYGTPKKTTEQYKQEVFDKCGDEYSVLGEYENNKVKIEMKHNKCGHTWFVSPNTFISHGNRCPKCKRSKGEEKIASLLTKHNVKYIREHKFEDCVNIKQLRFDFYIPDINICIEFNGRQHYEVVNAFGGIKEFERIQLRDKLKVDYCNDNNIELIVIHYKTDIESVLSERGVI